MSRLFLMRHGQTLFNVLHRKQGWCDSPLTEEGREQARRAGELIRERGLVFDHLYSSTSERACDTLELAMPHAPYERVKGLKEWNFGSFEGLTEDVNPELPYGDFYKPFGGEGEMEFRARLLDTLTEIMERPGHECVLAVSHGAACAQVMHALGYDYRSEGTRLGNCCLIELDYQHVGKLSVVGIDNPNA